MRGRLHRRAKGLSRAAVAALLLSVSVPAPAHAEFWCWLFHSGCDGSSATRETSQPTAAPEIDPSALANALALLAGGAAIFADRFRRR
jgi:hypothetical protein